MKILLKPGDELVVEVEETDGQFIIKFTDAELSVHTNMPDSDGRDNKIYSERFGNIFTNAHLLSFGNDEHFKEIRDKVVGILEHDFNQGHHQPKGTTRFDALGFDSLSSVNLITAVEKEFKVTLDDSTTAQVQNLNELYCAIYNKLHPLVKEDA